MRLPRECYQMQKTIETHLPHLSQPSAKGGTGLALWVCGAILAGTPARAPWPRPSRPGADGTACASTSGSGCTTAATGPALAKPNWISPLCFAPLLKWVLSWWSSGRLALSVAPTLKGDQTTAIVISVLYRPPQADAIPVAWSIHRANQKGSWIEPAVALLKELAPAVPEEMTVIVLCDRGISSPKLWTQIRAQGRHPCMRYRKNTTFCADGGKSATRGPARAFVSVPDTAWVGRGTAFGPPAT